MYQAFEKPTFSATIAYYDNDYFVSTSQSVLNVLESNNLFPPALIKLDKLTRGRFVKYKPSLRQLFVDAYATKDVLTISWETDDSSKSSNYCSFLWGLTFHKFSEHPVKNSSFKPWNVLSISATYDWLANLDNYNRFMSSVKDLVPVLLPFCIDIDDTAHANRLLHMVNEPHFKADYIQQIYWGNYLGEHLKDQVDLTRLYQLPVFQLEETERGIFFTLCDSIFDFDSENCEKLRKQIMSDVIRKQ